MKKFAIPMIAAASLLCSPSAGAWSLSDLFGGNASNTISNVIEGVFSTSNITVADMAGQWTIDGSAVCFQSENFLKKAGGVAAAAAIENKLDPYYRQYGLTGGVITIQTDGTFRLQLKKMSLSGTITKEESGNFEFAFTALGGIKVGSMTAYVQKTSGSMDIMFDATKLQSLLSVIAQFTGSKLASTATSILGSYEGICVGFGTTKTGTVEGENSSSGASSILNAIFGGGSSSSSTSGTQQNSGTTTQPDQDTQQNTGLGTLWQLLGGGKK